MLRGALIGIAAGAVGTAALNITTYADMAIRARPASSVPATIAGKLAERAGIDLAPEDAGEGVIQNRQSGLGALMGYGVGLGIGLAYSLVRPYVKEVPSPVAGVGLGLAAMAGSDVPAVTLGVTNPKTWGLSGWASDVIPHLIYGLVTATVYEVFSGMERTRSAKPSTMRKVRKT